MRKSLMMMTAALVLGLGVSFVAAQARAEGEDIGEMDYSYGKVLSVSPQEIVITEYDYEKDTEVNVTYMIDPELELQNIKALKDIVAGDEVEVYYDEKDGQKTARIISRPQIEDSVPAEPNDEEKAPGGQNPPPDVPPANSDQPSDPLPETKT